ncbi:outer membrane protein assembly factor BamB family protein [Streptomyces bambusae]|uniref:PQQ-binding-like beta-propeller repeat protein n=1 Tax=Streptomyces bambusae TaxID=1550616 RepID=A0ABS6ZFM3_9ACTN|nr:PQQ-binding-like beta-propeller repeat protein [Streptomyces bambusae]MBW5486559.1 PQQ-binding-like beta-propeller repeat protein [Streptomyces bambusae]
MIAQGNDGPSIRRTGRTPSIVLVALVAFCSLIAGCSSAGDEMDVVWDTPADRKTEHEGNGAWLSGDTLVRSRFDAVSGYNAADGKQSWEYVPPGRSAICYTAADTDSAVLVLTRDGDGGSGPAKDKACTTAVAIDMKNGRELWQAPVSAAESGLYRLRSYVVSAGSGLVVLRMGGELQALDVRSGKPRWKAALPEKCVAGGTAMAKRQVAALLACGGTDRTLDGEIPRNAELHAATFSPATGALQWSAPLGARSPVPHDSNAGFVSADPVIVAASQSGDSDSGAYFSFGPGGHPNPPIEFSGSYGEIPMAYRLRAAADDSRLYALPRRGKTPRYYSHRLTAFDLATGKPVWGASADDDRLDGDHGYRLLPKDGRLTVLTSLDDSDVYGLRVLDAATGKQRDARTFPEGQDPADTVFEYKDRLIAACYESPSSPSKPFTAYRRH